MFILLIILLFIAPLSYVIPLYSSDQISENTDHFMKKQKISSEHVSFKSDLQKVGFTEDEIKELNQKLEDVPQKDKGEELFSLSYFYIDEKQYKKAAKLWCLSVRFGLVDPDKLTSISEISRGLLNKIKDSQEDSITAEILEGAWSKEESVD